MCEGPMYETHIRHTYSTCQSVHVNLYQYPISYILTKNLTLTLKFADNLQYEHNPFYHWAVF